MTVHQQIIVGFLILSGATRAAAADRRMVEITCDGQQRVGTVVLHNDSAGWFLERDGRLDDFLLSDVSAFRELGRFRPWGVVELREQLGREFGSKFAVSSSSHYVVVAPPGTGERFTRLFEELYRQLVVVFSARGFRVREPEFPLIAVVHPDERSFIQHALTDKVRPQSGMRGYYLPSSNRVVLFDSSRSGLTDADGLDNTVIHEATHQAAFNLGIHSRLNADPKWVVEGLATAFEREGARLSHRQGGVLSRVNPERYAWFQRLRQTGRQPGTLVRLVQSDALFDGSVLDAYAEAWALTFYLLEKRPSEYVSYLQKLSRRSPWDEYAAEDRLKDFQSVFGRDLSLLEAQLLRYYSDLAAAE